MPQVKGPMPDPITGLSYTAHDPDDWRVRVARPLRLIHKSVQATAAEANQIDIAKNK